jgi:hypothetical protein
MGQISVSSELQSGRFSLGTFLLDSVLSLILCGCQAGVPRQLQLAGASVLFSATAAPAATRCLPCRMRDVTEFKIKV